MNTDGTITTDPMATKGTQNRDGLFQDPTKRNLATSSAARYEQNRSLIESRRRSIAAHRQGLIDITDIAPANERMRLRIEREGTSVQDALERINGSPNFQDVS